MVKTIDEFRVVCPLKEFEYDKIIFRKKLGEGGNASVFKVSIDNEMYAGKVYNITKWCDRNGDIEKFYECLEYELKIAKKLENTKYCVQTYGYSFTNDKMIVIMELLVSSGDLEAYLQDDKKWKTVNNKEKKDFVYYNKNEKLHWSFELPQKQKIKIVCNLFKAIKELHSKEIVHGDIKSDNTMLYYGEKRQGIKLIDFGMSYFSEAKNNFEIECRCGTDGYCAPEQYRYRLGYSSDIYSISVTAIEVWVGEIWKDGSDFDDCRDEVIEALEKVKKVNSSFGDLLERCLSLEMEKRPTAKQLLDAFYKIKFQSS